MHRIASGPLPGGGFFIACGRKPPRRRCATCGVLGAGLECDGCDKPLCASCSVSPKEGLDFCPACARPAWVHWWKTSPVVAGHREQRRSEFRSWARLNADTFLKLVPLGETAKRATIGGSHG